MKKTYNLYRCKALTKKTARGQMISASGVKEAEEMLAEMALSLDLIPDKNAIKALVNDSESGLYLWVDGDVCAIARIAFRDEEYARINSVYTAKSKRGRGYAGALVSALSQMIIESGLTPTILADESNSVSNYLDSSLGFECVGKIYEYFKKGVPQSENAIFYLR